MLENLGLNVVVLLMGISGLVPVFLIWKAAQLGKSNEVRYFTYLMASCAAYSIFYALELSATDISMKVLFLKLQYVGAVFFGPCILLFTLNYSGRDTVINSKFIYSIFIVPIISLLIVFSNDFHFLFYGSYLLVDNGVF